MAGARISASAPQRIWWPISASAPQRIWLPGGTARDGFAGRVGVPAHKCYTNIVGYPCGAKRSGIGLIHHGVARAAWPAVRRSPLRPLGRVGSVWAVAASPQAWLGQHPRNRWHASTNPSAVGFSYVSVCVGWN